MKMDQTVAKDRVTFFKTKHLNSLLILIIKIQQMLNIHNLEIALLTTKVLLAIKNKNLNNFNFSIDKIH